MNTRRMTEMCSSQTETNAVETVGYNGYFTLQWHITHRCNLRCTHCYQDDYTAFESADALENVLGQYEALLRKYHFKGYLNITGGEPMTHPGLFGLLAEAARRNIKTAVLTNGTMIGRREARLLKSCGVYYVQVSLDGMEKVHDSIRGEGSFKKAVSGIRALRSAGVFTTVSFTAQRENLAELPRLAKFCRDTGVNKLWFDRVVIPADEDVSHLSLTTEDFIKLSRRAARLNASGMVSCARALQFIPCRQKEIYRCTAGDRLLTVLADGSVMACRRLPIVSGNLRGTDLLTIYENDPALIRLRSVGVPQSCKSCGYSDLCAGGAKCIAYARKGRYDIPDPDCPILYKNK